MMTENVEKAFDQHPDRYDCPACLIDYWPDRPTYGLIIHDGGRSVIVISYCPWRGTKLPERAA